MEAARARSRWQQGNHRAVWIIPDADVAPEGKCSNACSRARREKCSTSRETSGEKASDRAESCRGPVPLHVWAPLGEHQEPAARSGSDKRGSLGFVLELQTLGAWR